MIAKNQNGIHILPVIIVAMFTLFMTCSAVAGTDPGEYVVVLLDGGGMNWQTARGLIEEFNGHVLHVIPPSALIGQIPLPAERLLRQQDPEITVVRNGDDARWRLQQLDTAQAGRSRSTGIASDPQRIALQFLAPPRAPAGVLESFYTTGPDGNRVEIPFEMLHAPPVIPEVSDPRSGQRSNESTSAFLSGDIAVGVIRPESNGTVDPNIEDWTQDEIDWTWYQMLQGNTWMAEDVAAEDITYVYRVEGDPVGSGTVTCDYEAINYGNHNSTVTLDLMDTLGYSGATSLEAKRAWLADLKTTFGTDWAYGIFIIDFSTTGGSTSSTASLGGPSIWTFNNRFAKTYRHEGGHIWGALDEYAGPADPNQNAGYTKEVNANTKTDNGEGYFSGAGEGIESVMTSGFRY
ncbi:MAG TPA: hypothetical protein PLV45_18870, partial [bacterium]|nr:hypothetical protein [bacterium]